MTTSIAPTRDNLGNYPPAMADAIIAGAQMDQAAGFIGYQLAAVGSGAALAEVPIGSVGPNGLASFALGAVEFAPAAGWTASNTAYFTITINKRTPGAPGTAVPIAIGTGQVSGANAMGSGTAWKAANLVVQAGATVEAGDVITIAVTQTGGGLNCPAGTISLYPN